MRRALATRSSRNPQPISNTILVQIKKQEKHPVNPVRKEEYQNTVDIPHIAPPYIKCPTFVKGVFNKRVKRWSLGLTF